MSLYYLILWNQVDILQKHFKKDHVHVRLWTRFYGTPNELWCAIYRSFEIMKHIHETWAFLVKSRILRTFVYNVYGSQNEFVKRVTRVFILRRRSLGQSRPLQRKTYLR